MTPERFGFAGLAALVLAGGIRLLVAGSGPFTLALAVVGVLLFLIYFFRAGRQVESFLGQRSTREGGNALGVMLFVLGSLILVNVLAARYRTWVDVTGDRLFTLAPETVSILRAAPEGPVVWGFFPEGDPQAPALEGLLAAAKMAEPRLEFRIVDPDREPVTASRFDLRQYGTVVEIGDRYDWFLGVDEEDFAATVLRASRSSRGRIAFLRGHGEAWPRDRGDDGIYSVSQSLMARGFDVLTLSILEGGSLDSIDVALLIGPQSEPAEAETDSLLAFMDRGGRLLLAVDPDHPVRLTPLLERVGLGFDPRYLSDPDLPDPGMIVSMEVTAHPAVAALRRGSGVFPAVFPGAGEVLRNPAPAGVRSAVIIGTGSRTTVTGDSLDAPRGRGVAAAAEWDVPEGLPGRLLVVGDADFASERHIARGANGDLFLGAVQWLTNDDELIGIRARKRTDRPVVMTRQQGRALLVAVVVIFPLIVLGSGVGVWWRRR